MADDKQAFEAFPDLTGHIMRMASTGQTGSGPEWCGFLDTLNAALTAAAALHTPMQEPVGWRIKLAGVCWSSHIHGTEQEAKDAAKPGESIQPLYTSPPPPSAPVQEPVGWKLVPVEPTKAMLMEHTGVHYRESDPVGHNLRCNIWRAMLAASPPPPSPAKDT